MKQSNKPKELESTNNSNTSNKQLLESEEKFRDLFEQAADAIILFDSQFNISDVNDAACNMLQYKKNELLGLNIIAIIEGQEQVDFEKRVEILNQLGASKYEKKVKRKDNSLVNTEVNIRKLKCGYLSVFRDITERKKAEEQQRENEERYKSIIAVSNTGAWEYHLNKNHIWYSKEYFSMVGKTYPEGMWNDNLEDNWVQLLHPDDREHSALLFKNYLENGCQGFYENHFRMKHQDGHWVWIWSRGQGLRDAEGNFTNVVMGTHIDVTEKTKAEENLKNSEALQRAMIENISDGVILLTGDFEIIYQSPSVEKITGYKYEERKSKAANELLYTEDNEYLSSIAKEVIDNPSTIFNYEIRAKHKSGKSILLDITMINLLQNPNIGAIMANYSDITERKKATELFQQQFENSPDIIVIVNRELKIESINRTYLVGLSAADCVGLDAIEVLPEESREHAKKTVMQCFESGENLEIENLASKSRWMRSRIVPIKTNGQVTSVMIIATNITKQKVAENQIIKSEEKSRALIENISDAILLIDKNEKIVFQSPSVMRITGHSVEDTKGANSWSFMHPDDVGPFRFFLREVINSPEVPFHKQWRAIHKSGKIIWVEGTVVNMFNNKFIRGIIINYRDITQRKEAELKISESQERYKSIIEVSNTGAWEYHLDTDDVWFSAEYFAMLGIIRPDGGNWDHTMNETWIQRLHPDDKKNATDLFEDYLKGNSEGMYKNQFRMLHQDGHWVWIWSQARRLKDTDGNLTNVVLGAHTDITERINAEKEKNEIRERTMAMLEEKVVERTEELNKTNSVLKLRNHEITDSINYAKNIQRAILSNSEDCQKLFPNSFVLWNPKDVVSGDFYWCYSNEKYQFIAVVDCTGHGVPGALMSIIANQMLDRVVNTFGFIEPKDILFHLDNAIVNSMQQETGIVKDGMDIALCRIDKETRTLKFAGAQRPLYYYDGQKLNEIIGNKAGVGGFITGHEHKEFAQTKINYKAGDSFYLTSDGYYSQFGGEKGKKMMKQRFHDYLSQIVNKTTAEQITLLHNFYSEWQGAEEQVDDVLVIGVKLD